MTLYDGNLGNTYLIKEIHVQPKLMVRLEALGLNYNTKIEIINRKKSGTMIVKVRGTRLAIGSQIAHGIEVQEFSSCKKSRTMGGHAHE